MTSADVVDFYTKLESLGIKIWIDGGWGVDALLGRQTRPHGDLDIAIQQKDVQRACELLAAEGYKEIRRDNEWNFVMADDKGHEIDFHSFILDDQERVIDGLQYPDGSLTGNGVIGGHAVMCVSPQHMVQFHIGYPLREHDFKDVAALCHKFGIEYPEEYAHLKKSH